MDMELLKKHGFTSIRVLQRFFHFIALEVPFLVALLAFILLPVLFGYWLAIVDG